MWKESKYGVFSGPNTGKHGAEKAPYLGTFHAVKITFHWDNYLILIYEFIITVSTVYITYYVKLCLQLLT